MVMACLQHPSHYKSSPGKMWEQSGGERAVRVHVTAWLTFGMSTHPPLHMIKGLKKPFCLHFKRIKPLAIFFFFFFSHLHFWPELKEVKPGQDPSWAQTQTSHNKSRPNRSAGKLFKAVFSLSAMHYMSNEHLSSCLKLDPRQEHGCSFTFLNHFISFHLHLLKQ